MTCPFLCAAIPSPLPVAVFESCKHLNFINGDAILVWTMRPEHVKYSNAQGSSALPCNRRES